MKFKQGSILPLWRIQEIEEGYWRFVKHMLKETDRMIWEKNRDVNELLRRCK